MFYTAVDDIPQIHAQARQAFLFGKLKSIAYRKEQIAQVGYMIKDNEQRFLEAMQHDLGRPYLETEFMDLSPVYIDVREAYDKVGKWAAKKNADFDLSFFPMRPKVRSEPKGVVLIIAPFNGPTVLLLSPLVGAIAGGNAAVLKPSEQTPAMSALFAELVPKYLDPDLYHVINGGIPETTKVLELPWDHILYTGNGRIARIIATAAAKHLTPVTLEGAYRERLFIAHNGVIGKNPVVVDPKCNVKLAATRVLWGRCLNSGQVCACPEYVLVPEDFQDSFIAALKEVYHSFYPEGPKNSKSLGRIVSEQHTQRIKNLIDNTRGTVVLGGEADVPKRYIAPTIVKDVEADDPLMSEEIFGPVLLIVPVKDVEAAIALISSREHPLVVYVFSQNKAFQDKVFDNTKSGAAVANDTMVHIGVPGLPAGGVGASGYGYYTGKDMFEQFTHKRACMDSPGWIDKVGFGCRYPPYKSLGPLRMLLSSLPPRPKQKQKQDSKRKSGVSRRWALWLSLALVGAASGVLMARKGGMTGKLL